MNKSGLIVKAARQCTAIFIFAALYVVCFAENQSIQTRRFIKGNISDKTRAVKEASGGEAYLLSREAMSFAVAYKKILGEDKELSALVTAAVLSLKKESVSRLDSNEKTALAGDFCTLFDLFLEDDTVCTAVINRALSMKEDLPLETFTAYLNRSIDDESLMPYIIGALGEIGDEKSFSALYFAKLKADEDEVNSALDAILNREPYALQIALSIVNNSKDATDNERMLAIAIGCNDNIKGEIASAVLKKSMERGDVSCEQKALSILSELRWTKSSELVSMLLKEKKDKWESSGGEWEVSNEVCKTIEAASIISPLESVPAICDILTSEVKKVKSEEVISCCIKALRAIGDKGAFEALLAVTNAPLSNALKASANAALQALKW